MPEAKVVSVVLALVPVNPPGLIVQLPIGKPLNTTLPVATIQVGCIMFPTEGTVGVEGCEPITTLAEAGEIHPLALVTLYV